MDISKWNFREDLDKAFKDIVSLPEVFLPADFHLFHYADVVDKSNPEYIKTTVRIGFQKMLEIENTIVEGKHFLMYVDYYDGTFNGAQYDKEILSYGTIEWERTFLNDVTEIKHRAGTANEEFVNYKEKGFSLLKDVTTLDVVKVLGMNGEWKWTFDNESIGDVMSYGVLKQAEPGRTVGDLVTKEADGTYSTKANLDTLRSAVKSSKYLDYPLLLDGVYYNK